MTLRCGGSAHWYGKWKWKKSHWFVAAGEQTWAARVSPLFLEVGQQAAAALVR